MHAAWPLHAYAYRYTNDPKDISAQANLARKEQILVGKEQILVELLKKEHRLMEGAYPAGVTCYTNAPHLPHLCWGTCACERAHAHAAVPRDPCCGDRETTCTRAWRWGEGRRHPGAPWRVLVGPSQCPAKLI